MFSLLLFVIYTTCLFVLSLGVNYDFFPESELSKQSNSNIHFFMDNVFFDIRVSIRTFFEKNNSLVPNGPDPLQLTFSGYKKSSNSFTEFSANKSWEFDSGSKTVLPHVFNYILLRKDNVPLIPVYPCHDERSVFAFQRSAIYVLLEESPCFSKPKLRSKIISHQNVIALIVEQNLSSSYLSRLIHKPSVYQQFDTFLSKHQQQFSQTNVYLSQARLEVDDREVYKILIYLQTPNQLQHIVDCFNSDYVSRHYSNSDALVAFDPNLRHTCSISILIENKYEHRSINKTSLLFVAVSFLLILVLGLVWVVFYYVQRCRYLHGKKKMSTQLADLAKKAIARIPSKVLNLDDKETNRDLYQCSICLDSFQVHEIVRTLPCRHIFHKTCIDPWLLEMRNCPMCKLNILQAFGLKPTVSVHSLEDISLRINSNNSNNSNRSRQCGGSLSLGLIDSLQHQPTTNHISLCPFAVNQNYAHNFFYFDRGADLTSSNSRQHNQFLLPIRSKSELALSSTQSPTQALIYDCLESKRLPAKSNESIWIGPTRSVPFQSLNIF